MQANFTKAKLQNADWTHALIGEYPSLVHETGVNSVAVHGAMTVTGCYDGKVGIWQDDKVAGPAPALSERLNMTADAILHECVKFNGV